MINNILEITSNILAISFFVLSVVVPLFNKFLFNRSINHIEYLELLIKYSLFFNVGCLFFLGFMGHMLYPSDVAAMLGWSKSPFQFQLAFSELAIAALGFYGTLSSNRFWLATIINTSIWLLGTSITHYFFAPNLAFMFYWNIFLVFWLILIYSIYYNYPKH